MVPELNLEDEVVAETAKLGKHPTVREALVAALLHYIQARGNREPRIVDLFGQVDFRDDWDYKAERARNG